MYDRLEDNLGVEDSLKLIDSMPDRIGAVLLVGKLLHRAKQNSYMHAKLRRSVWFSKNLGKDLLGLESGLALNQKKQ